MKMTAKSATFIGTGNTQSGISGVVEYARGGRTILLEVVVEKVQLKLRSLYLSSEFSEPF